MNIAILILIHKDNSQVRRLIAHLSKDFDIYLHIDKKMKVERGFDSARVFACSEYKVYWGSYNQIQATLFIMKEAARKSYDRYMIISGEDLPLVPNEQIVKFFEANDSEFLQIERLPNSSWKGNGGFDRLDYFYPNSARHGGVSWFESIPLRILEWLNSAILIPLMKTFSLRRKRIITYYGGSNWMDLTGGCVEKILLYLETHPDFLNHFRYTKSADEIFFQTIIGNLGAHVNVKNESLRFVDWETGPETPRVLRSNDLERILRSNYPFARKFDENMDNDVIRNIYDHIGAVDCGD